jgi:hypothetical protein
VSDPEPADQATTILSCGAASFTPLTRVRRRRSAGFPQRGVDARLKRQRPWINLMGATDAPLALNRQ